MLKVRVIPIVLWNGSHCVQTVRFGRPARVFGSLMDAVRLYERRNVDELVLLNIDAKDSGPLIDSIEWVASQLFCPVTYGGGIRTLEDIRDVLNAGADKVAIRCACLDDTFLDQATRKFGAQAIVAAIDVRHDGNMTFDKTWSAPFKDCITPAQWAHTMELFGVGEVLLTSVERNGTMSGYDLDLVRAVSEAVTIPVITHGGCGKPEHMLEAIKAGAHAVAASTMFLFTETVPRDCSRFLNAHGVNARVT